MRTWCVREIARLDPRLGAGFLTMARAVAALGVRVEGETIAKLVSDVHDLNGPIPATFECVSRPLSWYSVTNLRIVWTFICINWTEINKILTFGTRKKCFVCVFIRAVEYCVMNGRIYLQRCKWSVQLQFALISDVAGGERKVNWINVWK